MSSSLLRLSRPSTRSLLALKPTSTSTRSISSTSKLLASSETQDPQLGDYPQIKRGNLQNRKWSPRYWNTQEKRNFGETLHPEDDTLGVWAPDVHATPPASAVFQFGVAAAVAATFAALVYVSKVDRPALPRTYPRDGLAEELGGAQAAAPAEGAFDVKDDEEEDEE